MKRLFLDTNILSCYCDLDGLLTSKRKNIDKRLESKAVQELFAFQKEGRIILCTCEYVESEIKGTDGKYAERRNCMLALYRTLTLVPIRGIISGAQSRKGPGLTAGSDKICGGHEEMEPIIRALKLVLPIPVTYGSQGAYWNFKGEGFIDAMLLVNMLAHRTSDALITLDIDMIDSLRNSQKGIQNEEQLRIIEEARQCVMLPSEAVGCISRLHNVDRI